MKVRLIFPATAILISSMVALAHADDRENEPTAAQQAEAEKLIKDVYKEDYAKRGPEERKALADKLLEESRNTKSDAPSHYVLLREARDLSASLGEVESTMEAAEEMAKGFKVDPVETRLKALNGLKTSVRSVDGNLAAAAASLIVIELAMQSENFDAANKAADLASTFATNGKSMQTVAEIQVRKNDLKTQSTAYLEMKIAQDKLKADPKDTAAKFTVGTYMCMYKNDWDKGLAIAADGNNAEWTAAAKADIANPVDVSGMVKVADLWWDLAQKATGGKSRILVRAEFWYKLSLSSADGLVKAKIDKRLEQIEAGKINAQDLAVSEATRKLLPTAADMARLRELCAAAKTNSAKQEELSTVISSFDQRLRTDIYTLKENDYYARVKADLNVRKVVEAAGLGGILSYYNGPLHQTMANYWANSKSKEELAARVLAGEKFNNSEKLLEKTAFDSSVYSALRSFISNRYTMFPTNKERADLCQYVKTKGVKSIGVDRAKATYSTGSTRTLP